jgi:hypothetical protein
VAALPFGQTGALDVPELRAGLPATPYARHGDLVAYLLLLGLFGLSLLPRRPRLA